MAKRGRASDVGRKGSRAAGASFASSRPGDLGQVGHYLHGYRSAWIYDINQRIQREEI